MRRLLALVCFTSTVARAQSGTVVLRVHDTNGNRIPFAYAQVNGSNPEVASDSGVVRLRSEAKDSLKVVVRRIGYAPFGGWVRRSDGADEYEVILEELPRQLSAVDVRGRPDGPLARSGFYDRIARVNRSAVVARFITPEEIELRNPARVSQLLENEISVKVRRMSSRNLLTGRGGNCPMGLLVDGTRVTGTVEDILTREGEEELAYMMRSRGLRRDQAEREFLMGRVSIDDLVSSLSVGAMEVYASMAAVPPELQRNAAKNACGLVVVWTARR